MQEVLCLADGFIEKVSDPVDHWERYPGWNPKGRLSSSGLLFDLLNSVINAIYMRKRKSRIAERPIHRPEE